MSSPKKLFCGCPLGPHRSHLQFINTIYIHTWGVGGGGSRNIPGPDGPGWSVREVQTSGISIPGLGNFPDPGQRVQDFWM